MTPVKTFETSNVDLASFLVMEGIRFLGCTRSPVNSTIILLSFDDDRGSCLDLERVFLSSEFKKYRDINKWLLNKIHQALSQLPKS